MQNINLQLFGKVIDLSEELSSENPTLKLGDKEYDIDTRFKVVLELEKLFNANKADMDFIQQFLAITLGKEAAKEVMGMNLKMKSYKRIISVITEEVKGDSDDEESGATG